MAARLKTGDKVVVISGSSKGDTGVIKSVNPKLSIAVVENVNKAIRHEKKSANSEGGRRSKELPLGLSKLALIDSQTNKRTKVGFRFEDGKKVRYARKTGVTING